MSDWAGQAAQKTLEDKRLRDQNIERANRVSKIKAEAGPQLFKQLFDWLAEQVAAYNASLAQGSDAAEELSVKMGKSSKPSPELLDDEIVLARCDGKKNPVRIRYSPVLGVLIYECDLHREELTLYVGDDDQPVFKTDSHTPKTIPDIGRDVLDRFMRAKS